MLRVEGRCDAALPCCYACRWGWGGTYPGHSTLAQVSACTACPPSQPCWMCTCPVFTWMICVLERSLGLRVWYAVQGTNGVIAEQGVRRHARPALCCHVE